MHLADATSPLRLYSSFSYPTCSVLNDAQYLEKKPVDFPSITFSQSQLRDLSDLKARFRWSSRQCPITSQFLRLSGDCWICLEARIIEVSTDSTLRCPIIVEQTLIDMRAPDWPTEGWGTRASSSMVLEKMNSRPL